MIREWKALETMSEFGVQPVTSGKGRIMGCLMIQATLVNRIIEAQLKDEELRKWFDKTVAKDPADWNIGRDGGLRLKNRLVVPNADEIKKDIPEEAHRSRHTVHPGRTKMYKDLKRNFWWEGTKREVAEFVSKCLTCQQVQAEHQ